MTKSNKDKLRRITQTQYKDTLHKTIKAETAELNEISEQFWALKSLPIKFDDLLNTVDPRQSGTWFGINFRHPELDAWVPRHPVNDKPIYQVSSFYYDHCKDPSLNAENGFRRNISDD